MSEVDKRKRPNKRFMVALHQNLAQLIIKHAVKNGRSLTGQVNWLIYLWLEQQGDPITSADISEWEMRHRTAKREQ